MNNTRILAIVAVLTATTLIVGLTVAATMTPSAFTGGYKKDGHDKYVKGKPANDSSVVVQNGQNVICTHSSSTSPDNACTSQNNGLPPA